MNLHAVFELQLDAPIIVANGMTHQHEYKPELPAPLPDDLFMGCGTAEVSAVIDDFEAIITFHLEVVDNPLLRGHKLPAVERLSVKIIAEESRSVHSELDYSHIRSRFYGYLFVVMPRFLNYFRYTHGTPFLRSLNGGHIVSLAWFSEQSAQILVDPPGVFAAHYPGWPGHLGCSAIRPSELHKLQHALQAANEYAVVDELRAQAREAILEEKTLLAVLLLAVATEVAIKSKFYRSDSVTDDVFDYLEEKRKVTVSPPELIDSVAKRAFGTSFNKYNKDAFLKIDYLFQCRNKVAHVGQAVYRTSDDKKHSVDRETLEGWWEAVSLLLEWLSMRSAGVNKEDDISQRSEPAGIVPGKGEHRGYGFAKAT